MKADVAKQETEDGAADATAPSKPARSSELPLADEQSEAGEAEEAFEEVPTVANRALPGTGGESREAAPAQREGVGSYRLVRPTVSDFVEQPVATKIDPTPSKRARLGSARKPR